MGCKSYFCTEKVAKERKKRYNGKCWAREHKADARQERWVKASSFWTAKRKSREPMKDEKSLKEVSDEIIREMSAWNASNPKATFLEIEVKARELVSKLEAQLIQESAVERETADWFKPEQRGRPTCPKCQVPLLWRGKRARHLQGTAGRDIHLQRTYGTCPTCGIGFFPPR